MIDVRVLVAGLAGSAIVIAGAWFAFTILAPIIGFWQ